MSFSREATYSFYPIPNPSLSVFNYESTRQYSKALLNVDMKSVLSEHGVETGCEANAAVDMGPTLHDLEAAA